MYEKIQTGMPTNTTPMKSTTPTNVLTSPSTTIVSQIAYLIGVPDIRFGAEYEAEVYSTLEAAPEAKTVRCLSIIRNKLLLQNGAISNHIRRTLYGNIDEFIDTDIFDYLESQGIEILKTRPVVNEYIAEINQILPGRIEACKALFPDWLEWPYVRRLFTMNSKDIDGVVDIIHIRKRNFPFQCYLNWPVQDPAAYPTGRWSGNILQNDPTFLRLLYYVNGATFTGQEHDLGKFIEDAESIVLAVDCENSDPYKLCSAMDRLRTECPQSFSKIRKTVLFDDVHTSETWRMLSDFLPIPVEHILTHRVNDHKSLVDIQLTAGVAKEHYAGGVDSFLLASSDSDYWGLIRSLPTARFMVLAQREKIGDCMRQALEDGGIPFCTLDSLAGNVDEMKAKVIDAAVQSKLKDIDLKSHISEQIENLRLDLTLEQKEQHVQRILSGLSIEPQTGVLRV